MPIPTESQMVDNLREIRAAASDDNVREGSAWYPSAGRIAARLSADYFMSKRQAAGILAAFSQNATWKANLTMAENYCAGFPAGMKSVLAECDAIMAGADPAEIMNGSKRPSFYLNIIGRHTYVTCDRWHLRAAGCEGASLTPELCAMVTRATRRVAREFGEGASTCQAIIWCAMRGHGA